MSASELNWDDDEILVALRLAVQARQAVPPDFMAAARNVFAWHNIDAELAQLTYDSARDADFAQQTRAEAATIRALTFTSARLSVELEVTADSVLGQLVPAQIAAVRVRHQDGAEATVIADEIGCFRIDPIPAGSFRLQCRTADGIEILTGWLRLGDAS
jgi:hypothetical protein